MSYKDIENQYTSWKGNLKNYLCYNTMKNMDILFNELFIEPFIKEGGGFINANN